MRTEASPVLRFIRGIADNQRLGRLSDEELLRQFSSQGDEAAFRALVGRHGAMVYDVCRNVLANEANAEDAFQATFLVLAQKAKTIRKKASVSSWLYGVAYRTACRARASAARRQKHEGAAASPPPVWPGDDLSWREVRCALHEELSKVSDCYRAPLVLCYLEGKSQEQAALQLGVSKDRVKQRLERGRALLRGRLLHRGLGPAAVLLTAAWPSAKASALPAAQAVKAVVKAATLVASQPTVAASLLSPRVAALSQEVTKTMFLSKLTALAAGLLVTAAGTLLVGVNTLPQSAAAQQTAPSKEKQPPGDASAPQAARPGGQGDAGGGKEVRPTDAPLKEPAEASGLPSAVRQVLERNARGFAPIAVTVQKQRSVPDPESERAKLILRTFPGFLKPLTHEYLAQNEMCQARRNYWGGVQTFDWQEFSWDGRCAYWGHLYLSPHALEIVPVEKLASDRQSRDAWWFEPDDYLAMIGVSVPRTMKELPAGRQSELLRLLEKDGRLIATGNQRLPGQATTFFVAEVQGDKKHRFWFDPSLGYAVRRHEVWDAAGELEVVIDNSDFVKLTAPDVWLPRHAHAEWQAWRRYPREKLNGKTKIVVDLQATRLERVAVPSERFTLNYGPGSYVSDARPAAAAKSKNGRVDYLQPNSPAEVERIIAAKQTGKEYVPPPRYTALWIVGGGLALFVAAAGAFVLILRRRRGRAKE